jgi:two-component system, chemotaxis family, chemotaxis protein CheY
VARVLIVDDAADIRALVRLTLDRDGHEVVGEGRDGREAIELTASLNPDVVVLDVRMPNMTGLEALPMITRAAPDARVVVVNSLPNVTLSKVQALGGHALVHRRDHDEIGDAVSALVAG